MKYELIKDSNAGVIIDPTPILLDIKDTFKVSFVLPEEGAYIALFRGEDNAEYKAVIKDSMAILPKELFKKEQRVGLTVCQIENEKIIHAWECHSLRIGAFLYLRQTQWQITAAVDDKEIYARIAELERSHAETITENKRFMSEFSKVAQEYANQLAENARTLASVKKANETLATEYNKAIKVINDLSERVNALEKNYDPTIIK